MGLYQKSLVESKGSQFGPSEFLLTPEKKRSHGKTDSRFTFNDVLNTLSEEIEINSIKKLDSEPGKTQVSHNWLKSEKNRQRLKSMTSDFLQQKQKELLDELYTELEGDESLISYKFHELRADIIDFHAEFNRIRYEP